MKAADLHLHTYFSDGTFSPEEVVAQAQSVGLAAIALTDHDTVEGCVRAAMACRAAGIDFVPGVELTAEQGGTEIHVLGYCIDVSNPKFLTEVARFQTVRQDRIREIVARLNRLGVPLEADAVFALANCKAPGRPHVARALVSARLCGSLDEAFERFLKKNRPAWVPKHKMSAAEAISLVREAGGIASMAHPGLNDADDSIPAMVDDGLEGLECYHTKHSPADSEHYLELARKYNLLVTGGSDCHGTSKGRPLIGTVRVDLELVNRLQQRAKQRQKPNGV
jgi:predicted metal-dependent phosphoesterase TrpH